MENPVLSLEHARQLRAAKSLLERPSLAARITDVVGAPIEKGFELLPSGWSDTLQQAVETSLMRALKVAVRSLRARPLESARLRMHKAAVVTTGAAGGAFGWPGLLIELPISTTLMLRSIADIARAEGEDVDQIETQLACIEVFALGGRSVEDDAAETGYLAVRSALARSISEASRHIAQHGLTRQGSPALVRLISNIASRFGVVVSEKAAAAAIPVIGAAGGAIVNSLFINHFQAIARGHFIVRRLERIYGSSVVQRAYAETELH